MLLVDVAAAAAVPWLKDRPLESICLNLLDDDGKVLSVDFLDSSVVVAVEEEDEELNVEC